MSWLWYDYHMIIHWLPMIHHDTGWSDGMMEYPEYPMPIQPIHALWCHMTPDIHVLLEPKQYHHFIFVIIRHTISPDFTRKANLGDDIGSCNTFNTFQHISPPPMKINPPMILQRQVAKWHCAVGRSGAYLKPEATQHRPLRSEP